VSGWVFRAVTLLQILDFVARPVDSAAMHLGCFGLPRIYAVTEISKKLVVCYQLY
jgi:hypothetical protein